MRSSPSTRTTRGCWGSSQRAEGTVNEGTFQGHILGLRVTRVGSRAIEVIVCSQRSRVGREDGVKGLFGVAVK